jgi:hypothetical protein
MMAEKDKDNTPVWESPIGVKRQFNFTDYFLQYICLHSSK